MGDTQVVGGHLSENWQFQGLFNRAITTALETGNALAPAPAMSVFSPTTARSSRRQKWPAGSPWNGAPGWQQSARSQPQQPGQPTNTSMGQSKNKHVLHVTLTLSSTL